MFYIEIIKTLFQNISTYLHIFPISIFIQTFKTREKNYNSTSIKPNNGRLPEPFRRPGWINITTQ
nr:MAG TPA: hypothetical protein [Caudoviricetes sp.]